MFKSLKKRGYYFIIDAFIGSTIVFLSLLIILNGGIKPAKIQYNYEMAEEYGSFILTTKMEDLRTHPYVNGLIANHVINDTSLSIMEEVDMLYYYNNLPDATGLIQNLTEPLIPQKYGFSYSIIDGANTTIVYNRTTININDSTMVIASKKITFLQLNSSTMFGPAMTEIKIWI